MNTKKILPLKDVFQDDSFIELFEEQYSYVPAHKKEIQWDDKSVNLNWVLEETLWSDDTCTMRLRSMEGSEHTDLYMSNFEKVRKRIRRIQFSSAVVKFPTLAGTTYEMKFCIERIQECRDKDIRFTKDNLVINYKQMENATV